MSSLLETRQLMDLYFQVDLPLVFVLAEMEHHGVQVDGDWLRQLSLAMQKELKTIQEKIQAYALTPVNLNSPQQLRKFLFQDLQLPPQGKTKTGFSTDVHVLETLASVHPVPGWLLEYRELAKLKNTYVDPLPELSSRSGRIHTCFHQTVTATGRLSSSNPNLQNIPARTARGVQIRRAFVASEGNLLLSSDYSQIELRILAHLSRDPDLIESFQRGEDIHRRTAGEIFGIPPQQVSSEQRFVAKAINFGLIYGKTAFGLSRELKIPRKEAQDRIDRYFQRYRFVKNFLETQVEQARQSGCVSTLLGRNRVLRDIHSKNHILRANAERMAMNTPIQGTAADLMKLAMIEIYRRLKAQRLRSFLMIQVHDEVVLDCPREEIGVVQSLVESAMMNAMSFSVPLRVCSAVGENWMSLSLFEKTGCP